MDADGYFFPSSDALDANHPDLKQVEAELRAQIQRAVHSGLKIDYVDYHMGTVLDYPRFREIAEHLANEYRLGMIAVLRRTADTIPSTMPRPQDKTDSLIALINRLKPGVTVLVTHVGIDNAELGALLDMNTNGGLPEMSKNRQGELDALTSQRFRDALKARDIHLLTYRQLIAMQGLKSMRRPEG